MESKAPAATASISTTRPAEITRLGSGSSGERRAIRPSPGSSTAKPSKLTRCRSMNRILPTGWPLTGSGMPGLLSPLLDRALRAQLDHPAATWLGLAGAGLAGGADHDPDPVAAEQVLGELERRTVRVAGGPGDGQQRRPSRHIQHLGFVRRRGNHLDPLHRPG